MLALAGSYQSSRSLSESVTVFSPGASSPLNPVGSILGSLATTLSLDRVDCRDDTRDGRALLIADLSPTTSCWVRAIDRDSSAWPAAISRIAASITALCSCVADGDRVSKGPGGVNGIGIVLGELWYAGVSPVGELFPGFGCAGPGYTGSGSSSAAVASITDVEGPGVGVVAGAFSPACARLRVVIDDTRARTAPARPPTLIRGRIVGLGAR